MDREEKATREKNKKKGLHIREQLFFNTVVQKIVSRKVFGLKYKQINWIKILIKQECAFFFFFLIIFKTIFQILPINFPLFLHVESVLIILKSFFLIITHKDMLLR